MPLNHPKTDRMLELARAWRLPVVFFTEGGGGRAGTGGNRTGAPNGGDSNRAWLTRPLVTPTFSSMARLNGVVPTIGINSGYCFAGNAALLGACDVIIATEDSNIGMGGPAMIEGGGLGVFSPDEVGPIDVQLANGVVDIGVRDEAEGVAVAKQYLGYFQGPLPEWSCADQRVLRSIIPANRLRTYDIRAVIEGLADTGSVLELRRHFGLGMVTALARIEGQPVGILANNPTHLAGAIDSDGSDKAARFMQLLDAFDIPLLVLCDTPGIMVGPEVEKTGARAPLQPAVRHRRQPRRSRCSCVVLRKAYGLGALGHGRRQRDGAVLRRVVADGRVRRHGPRGPDQARLPQRAGQHRGPGGPAGPLRRAGRPGLRAEQGHPPGRGLRRRRRDRPDGHPPLAGERPALGRQPAPARPTGSKRIDVW